jgi:DNA repair exonuclease SbcCD ATPase subunit
MLMSGTNLTDSPRTQCLDSLFAQMAGESLSGARSPSRHVNGPRFPESFTTNERSAPALDAPTKPPPELKSPNDLSAAHQWLQNERARLEDYTRQQMARIQQQHQALLAKEYSIEEALVVRSQELNREVQFLASQAQVLQARARQLTEREAALADQMGKLSRAQEEFLVIQQTSNDMQKDTEVQHAYLEGLLAETALLQAQEASVRGKFATCEAELKERQQAWEQRQIELDERQIEIEERYVALERAEQAVQRRMAELDEMEDRLQQEVETQEKQLHRERQDLQVIWTTLSLQRLGPDDDGDIDLD